MTLNFCKPFRQQRQPRFHLTCPAVRLSQQGFADDIQQYGGAVEVREKDLVEVGSLHTLETPEYAQPTSG